MLRDDELRSILERVESEKDSETFRLVCKQWLQVQSTERKKLAACAGPHMLWKMADRFARLVKLDLVQSISRSFYLGVTDSNLAVIGTAFTCFYGTNSEGVVEVGNSIWVKGGWENSDMGEVCNILIFVI